MWTKVSLKSKGTVDHKEGQSEGQKLRLLHVLNESQAKSHKIHQLKSQNADSVHYHNQTAKLHSLKSQEQDNPSRWYSLLQISASVYYLSDISHLIYPVFRKGPWSFSKQETLRELEGSGSGLYKPLRELCCEPAVTSPYLCPALLGLSGSWDASLALGPGSI